MTRGYLRPPLNEHEVKREDAKVNEGGTDRGSDSNDLEYKRLSEKVTKLVDEYGLDRHGAGGRDSVGLSLGWRVRRRIDSEGDWPNEELARLEARLCGEEAMKDFTFFAREDPSSLCTW